MAYGCCVCGRGAPEVPVEHCQRENMGTEVHLVRAGAGTVMQLQDSCLQKTLVLYCPV